MDTEQPIPTVPPAAPAAVPATEEHRPLAHTYQDDLNQAMDVTDPAAVQKMLADARDEEMIEAARTETQHERRWYGLTSFLLILLALAALAYGTYYYMRLTVKVQPAPSVGAFQTSPAIVASSTSIQQVLATMTAATDLPVGKPELITLVTDNNVQLTNSQLYDFIGATVPEPLQAVIAVARLGVVNTGKDIVPFIVASVNDQDKASNEFLIAEPSLLQMFYQALNIDISGIQQTTPQTFQSQYFNNIAVRTFTVTNATTGQQHTLLYGAIPNNVMVITTTPDALKAVYDSIINQH